MKWWVSRLEAITGSLRSASIAEFKAEVQVKYEVVEGAINVFGGGLYEGFAQDLTERGSDDVV